MAEFYVYDVFSAEAFGGNPLAVIPDATGLPEEDLQKIAREFNFSETTFVFPANDPANTAKVRIFTPTMEIPFAGHPTIGTAVALSDQGAPPEMVLELGVGPLQCHALNGQARFTTEVPLEVLAHPTVDDVCAALGITSGDIETSTHAPVMATLGLPFTITELTSRAVLASIETNITGFKSGAATYPGALDFAQFVYWREGNMIHARMFAPLDNIPEDPATGSACATLGALLTDLSGSDQALTIHQGEDMGRLSVIQLTTQGQAVTISGAAKRVMQGRLVY